MRRLLGALAAVTLWTCSPTRVEDDSQPPDEQSVAMVLVSSKWPPYTGNRGEPRAALELVEEALARMGYQPKIEVYDRFEEAEAKLKSPDYAGSPALWRNADRESYLLYSQPYLENRLVLVARAGADVSAPNLEALAGRRVGIVQDYAYGEEIARATQTVFVPQPSTADNLRSLLKGELDYVLADELLVHHVVAQQPEEAARQIVVGDNTMVRRSLHLAVRKDYPDAEVIIARFNELLQTMLGDGSYHQALGVRWIRADVDGDGREELALNGQKAGQTPPVHPYRWLRSEAGLGGADQPIQFFVDGKHYDHWDDIPPQYKVPEGRIDENPGTVNFIQFRF